MRIATFALFLGLAYISAGVLGLVPAALMPAPADAPPTRYTALYGYLLGLFPVNALHSIVHLGIGIWGVMGWRRIANPKFFARAIAVLYGVLAVLGLIPGVNTLFGLLPLHGHDVWLHGATAIVGAYFGWRTEHEVERRAYPAPDRREHSVPVAHERRFGHGDRRLPTSEV